MYINIIFLIKKLKIKLFKVRIIIINMDTYTTTQIILVSKDALKIPISVEVAKISKLIETMLPEETSEETCIEIPLQNVDGDTLTKVVEFLEMYSKEPMTEIAKPLLSTNMAEIVQEKYASFVDVEQEKLFNIILAANYMDIKPLLDLTCATVASHIKGKTPDEIRKAFNIQNEASEEIGF